MSNLPEDVWQSVQPTVELASITTLILLLLVTPLAWWLARSKVRRAEAIAAVIALPLVLPPTVLGFYLLVMLGPNGPGGLIAGLWGGRTLAFTFEGLVIGSVLYAMPFVVQPTRNAFAAIDRWRPSAPRRGARSGRTVSPAATGPEPTRCSPSCRVTSDTCPGAA
jgi:molybdate transport system permease protein